MDDLSACSHKMKEELKYSLCRCFHLFQSISLMNGLTRINHWTTLIHVPLHAYNFRPHTFFIYMKTPIPKWCKSKKLENKLAPNSGSQSSLPQVYYDELSNFRSKHLYPGGLKLPFFLTILNRHKSTVLISLLRCLLIYCIV